MAAFSCVKESNMIPGRSINVSSLPRPGPNHGLFNLVVTGTPFLRIRRSGHEDEHSLPSIVRNYECLDLQPHPTTPPLCGAYLIMGQVYLHSDW
jgi:hypothetical protein